MAKKPILNAISIDIQIDPIIEEADLLNDGGHYPRSAYTMGFSEQIFIGTP